MKITFSLVDAKGMEFRGSAVLTPVGSRQPDRAKAITKSNSGVSFGGNPRAFMKRHSVGLSGSEKFTLLLAKLAQGDVSKTVSRSDIFATWDKMTGILGKSNGAYANRAKDNGWVDSPKNGVYVLCDSWVEILPK